MKMIWLSILVGGIVVIIVFLLIFYRLAPANRFTTFVKEGSAKLIVKGEAFEKALIQYADRIFLGDKKQVEGDKKWEVVEGKEHRHLFGGLRLYSLLYPLFDVYIYHHHWTHQHADGSIVTHDKWLDYVFLKSDIYVIDLPLKEKEGAEDINGMPMGIKMILPMRIINPYIAVFRVRKWLPMITGIIQARLRQFVTNYRYKEDLLNMRAGVGIKKVQKEAGVPKGDQNKQGDDLLQQFWNEAKKDFEAEEGKVDENIITVYGVEIDKKGARILKIDPSEDYQRFTTMKYEAEKEKEKTIIQADAERERLDRIYSIIQKHGDLGKLVRTLEALEKSPEKGAKWIIPLPGFADLFKGIFGGRTLETINPQEFRELREMVEKLLK